MLLRAGLVPRVPLRRVTTGRACWARTATADPPRPASTSAGAKGARPSSGKPPRVSASARPRSRADASSSSTAKATSAAAGPGRRHRRRALAEHLPHELRGLLRLQPGPARAAARGRRSGLHLRGRGAPALPRRASGALRWEIDTAERFSVAQNFFGVGASPLVEGDLLIVPVGGHRRTAPRSIPGRCAGTAPGSWPSTSSRVLFVGR